MKQFYFTVIQMVIATIDIGSNSVRLMLMADGKTLYKKVSTTKLAKGMTQDGELAKESMLRTVEAIRLYAKIAEDSAQKVFIFATAAVRSATNKSEFLMMVKQACGLDVDVISGHLEAKVGLLGAVGDGDGGIIDIGGASTEITIQRNGVIVYSQSVDIGAVKLFDLAGRDYTEIDRVVQRFIGQFKNIAYKNDVMYAIGGTALTIASVVQELEVYMPEIVNGTKITIDKVEELARHVLSLSVEQVKAIKGMDKTRADTIGGGCVILLQVLKLLGISEVIASESDNLEGYTYYALSGKKI